MAPSWAEAINWLWTVAEPGENLFKADQRGKRGEWNEWRRRALMDGDGEF
jgi:hypothetical protein